MENQEMKMVEGFAFSGYEIESAISSTAAVASESKGEALDILLGHLRALCALQLEQLSGSPDDAMSEFKWSVDTTTKGH